MTILFPYRPDWSRGLSVKHSFLTEIITSRSKREQRIAQRVLPRKTVEFDLKLSRGDLAGFQGFMAANQQAPLWLIDWTRNAPLAAPVAAAATVLTFAATPGWARVGQEVFIKEAGQEENVTITGIGATSITIDPATAYSWTSGAKVYPLLPGRLDQSIRGRLLTNMAAEVSVGFSVDPGNSSEDDDAIPAVFNTRELVLTKPNWRETPSFTLSGDLEDVDFGRGTVSHYSYVGFNHRQTQFGFLGRTAAEANQIEGWFRRARGQQGEFYMPTWEPDISPEIGAAPGATYLDVPGYDLYAAYAGSSVYKAMIALFPDGSYEAKSIVSITTVGPNSRITLSSALVNALNPSTVTQICFLPVWRFATDELTMEWATNSVAQCQTTMLALEDL